MWNSGPLKNTTGHVTTFNVETRPPKHAWCASTTIQPDSTYQPSCRSVDVQLHISSSVVHSSSQESKHGDGAVTVMEHMLKSQSESMGRGDSILRDKASALRTETSCVSYSSSNGFNLCLLMELLTLNYQQGMFTYQGSSGQTSDYEVKNPVWVKKKTQQCQSKHYILTKHTTDLHTPLVFILYVLFLLIS